MSRPSKHPEPFFMLFPWFRTGGLLCLLGFIALFIFRLSETGGKESCRACAAAMITVAVGGICSLYPLCKAWRRGIMVALTAVMLGSLIRLLIGVAGLAIILLFTYANKTWFVFYVSIYYIVFLTIDMVFALWMLNHGRRSDVQERRFNGNMWDMVS